MPIARFSTPKALILAPILILLGSTPSIASSYILTDLGRTNHLAAPTSGFNNDFITLTSVGQIVYGFGNTKNGSYNIQNDPYDTSVPSAFTLKGPGGQSSTLDLTGTRWNGLNVYGFGVNASGTVVGSRFDSPQVKMGVPIEYTAKGGMVDLPSLDGPSAALAINNSGLIVGETYFRSDDRRAFLIHDKMVADLNSLIPPNSGLTLIEATGIDDAGRIVGYASDTKDPEHLHEYLLTPTVPEPATFWVIGVGLGCFAWHRSRGRRRTDRGSVGR